MTKVSRTFRLDIELSKRLDRITTPPYTYTWHLEKALEAYLADLEAAKARVLLTLNPIKDGD